MTRLCRRHLMKRLAAGRGCLVKYCLHLRIELNHDLPLHMSSPFGAACARGLLLLRLLGNRKMAGNGSARRAPVHFAPALGLELFCSWWTRKRKSHAWKS